MWHKIGLAEKRSNFWRYVRKCVCVIITLLPGFIAATISSHKNGIAMEFQWLGALAAAWS